MPASSSSNAASTPVAAAAPSTTAATMLYPVDGNGAGASTVDMLRVARSQAPRSASPGATMEAYRAFRDKIRRPVLSTYNILGFLSSGTYGRVYKASLKHPPPHHQAPQHHHALHHPAGSASAAASVTPASVTQAAMNDDETSGLVFAIKKFKPDKEDHATYTGISQSAMREIALNRELHHENIVSLREVILEDKAIYMVFHYASHDLLQLIHHHSSVLRTAIQPAVLKSLLFQLLNGVHYLHCHFVLHRDLKPANILLTCNGIVKIADLGLARVYQAPLQSLYAGDKVVVTIWYRAPELLLGARHYNAKIDMWAIGCIWGELLALRPMFKGEEAKMDPKTKTTPFQNDQVTRIVEIMGVPNKDRWPNIEYMPDYKHMWPLMRADNYPNILYSWYEQRASSPSASSGFDLFDALLQYDPNRRLSAKEALMHTWFQDIEPLPTANAFVSLPNGNTIYPARRLIKDESDPKMVITQPTATHVGGAHYGGAGANSVAAGGAAHLSVVGQGVGGSLPAGGNVSSASHLGAARVLSGAGGASLHGDSLTGHMLSAAVGPPAPPPAPGSVGSVGPPSSINSAGPSGPFGAASSAAGGSVGASAQQARGANANNIGGANMVATATANAANAAARQTKRPRNR